MATPLATDSAPMTKTSELKELINFLRSEGVTSYEENGIKLTLLPEKPESLKPFEIEAKKVRRDKRYNMTEEEQIAMFNHVVSSVE